MDVPLVGFIAFGAWFAFLVGGDIVVLLNIPPKPLATAHTVAFVVSLCSVMAFGYTLAAEIHPKPCAHTVGSR